MHDYITMKKDICFKPLKLNASYAIVTCFNVCFHRVSRNLCYYMLLLSLLSYYFLFLYSIHECIHVVIFKIILLLKYLSDLQFDHNIIFVANKSLQKVTTWLYFWWKKNIYFNMIAPCFNMCFHHVSQNF